MPLTYELIVKDTRRLWCHFLSLVSADGESKRGSVSLRKKKRRSTRARKKIQEEKPCILAILKLIFSLSLDYKVSDVQYQLILDVLRLLKHAIISH